MCYCFSLPYMQSYFGSLEFCFLYGFTNPMPFTFYLNKGLYLPYTGAGLLGYKFMDIHPSLHTTLLITLESALSKVWFLFAAGQRFLDQCLSLWLFTILQSSRKELKVRTEGSGWCRAVQSESQKLLSNKFIFIVKEYDAFHL